MRITGMILATDMASHQGHLDAIKAKIHVKHVTKEKQNGHLLIDSSDEMSMFKH